MADEIVPAGSYLTRIQILDEELERNKVAAAVEGKKTRHAEVFAKVQERLKDYGKLLEEVDTLQLKRSELYIKKGDTEADLHQTLQDIDRLRKKQDEVFKECQQLMADLNDRSKMSRLRYLRQQLSSDTDTCSQMAAAAPQVEVELQEEKKTWYEKALANVQERLKDYGKLSEEEDALQLKQSELSIKVEDLREDLWKIRQDIDRLRKKQDEVFKEYQQLMADLNDRSKMLPEEMNSRRQLEEAPNTLRPAVMEALLSEGVHDSPDPSDSAPLDTRAEAADG